MKHDNGDVTQLSLFGEPSQSLQQPEKKPPRYGNDYQSTRRKARVGILLFEGGQRGYPAIVVEVTSGHPFSISAGEFAYRYAVQTEASVEEINAAIRWLRQN
jgi:hypothetical protein